MGGRARSIYDKRPISNVPLVDWGNKDDISGIKISSADIFRGNTGEMTEAIGWINKIMAMGSANGLTLQAGAKLLQRASGGGVTDYIDQMIREGHTLTKIVCSLEGRYAEVLDPRDATVKCNALERKPGELLPSFVDRLRCYARMATTHFNDEETRNVEVNKIIDLNIRRIIHPSIAVTLQMEENQRRNAGLEPFELNQLENYCIEHERRRMNKIEASVARSKQYHSGAARAVEQYEDFDMLNDISSSGESDIEEEEVFDAMIVSEIRRIQAQNPGKRLDQKKVYKRAFDQARKKMARQPSQSVSNVMDGPPGKLHDAPKRNITELLRDANCVRGECIHCGVRGHIMYNEACGLRGKPVMDQVCRRCQKGLHSADDCPRPYQGRQLDINQVQAMIEILKNEV
jgi:hypothetical protein